jgi:S-adenosylmethionine synthetase
MGLILVGGQITTTALFDVEQAIRKLGNEIGYHLMRRCSDSIGPADL